MSQELASFLASLELDPADSKRADELAAKARCGTLTAVEEDEIEEYRRRGRMIEALKLRALKGLEHSAMNNELVELVWLRAGNRCEYCHFPAEVAWLPFQIDHVIAEKHGGFSDANNLALIPRVIQSRQFNCFIPDAKFGRITFHGEVIFGMVERPRGEQRLPLLRINSPDALEFRASLLDSGYQL